MIIVSSTFLFSVASADDPSNDELTDDNYDEKTRGKVIFVMFYLPYCGHSMALQPTFSELESEYFKNGTHLVQRINCEDENGRKTVKLCNYNGINAYPSIMYGNPQALKLYTGPFELNNFKTFINGMKVPCTPEYFEYCDKEQQETMMHAMSMTEEQIQLSIENEEEKIRNVTASYDLKLKEIESMYEQMMDEQKEEIEKIKRGDLALYKSVQVSGKENYEEILKSLLIKKHENGE
eukprot:g382.t1